MTIQKLPSGSYRIQMMEHGKRYSITVPFKPTQKQAYELIREKIDKPMSRYASMTFSEASEQYIKNKSAVLSPTTIKGYKSILRSLPEHFMKMQLSDIDQPTIQALINEHAASHSAKTTTNVNGLISAIMSMYKPDMVLNITLPQRTHHESYIPSADEVKRMLELAEPTDFYVPLSLACLSLRRSEICGLDVSDLDENNYLTIHRSLVIDSDNNLVYKDLLKTDASYRTIAIPDALADRIRSQGYVYNHTPTALDHWLRRNLPKLDIPFFSVHKLRHFFASYSHEMGYSDAVIQSIGGWNTDHVMKSVYRHAMNKDEARRNMSSDIGKLF